MKLVVIESPYAAVDSRTLARNLTYLRQAMRDCLLRGEAVFASHAIYAQEGVLDDRLSEERRLGIEAGLAWGAHADLVAVYTDLGITPGMEIGIAAARRAGRPVELRTLPGWENDRVA